MNVVATNSPVLHVALGVSVLGTAGPHLEPGSLGANRLAERASRTSQES
jgi:hypothetical protein